MGDDTHNTIMESHDDASVLSRVTPELLERIAMNMEPSPQVCRALRHMLLQRESAKLFGCRGDAGLSVQSIDLKPRPRTSVCYVRVEQLKEGIKRKHAANLWRGQREAVTREAACGIRTCGTLEREPQAAAVQGRSWWGEAEETSINRGGTETQSGGTEEETNERIAIQGTVTRRLRLAPDARRNAREENANAGTTRRPTAGIVGGIDRRAQ